VLRRASLLQLHTDDAVHALHQLLKLLLLLLLM
jgi:hypothetical protein